MRIKALHFSTDFTQVIQSTRYDFRGTVLKAPFSTATITDVHQLHETLNQLQTRNSDFLHSLSDQLTYIKKFDTLKGINTDAITNLPSIVKDVVVQSRDRFQQTAGDMWLNVSIHNQSELYMAIRQLEFTLLQLIQQVNELFVAIQRTLQGKLPIALVDTTTLQNIL